VSKNLKSIDIRKIYILKHEEAHDFCGLFHVSNTPTLEELKQSDVPDLVDMLSKQSIEYSSIIKPKELLPKAMQ
jgi:hypothetical protein